MNPYDVANARKNSPSARRRTVATPLTGKAYLAHLEQSAKEADTWPDWKKGEKAKLKTTDIGPCKWEIPHKHDNGWILCEVPLPVWIPNQYLLAIHREKCKSCRCWTPKDRLRNEAAALEGQHDKA